MICIKCNCKFAPARKYEIVCSICRDEHIQLLPADEVPTGIKKKPVPYELPWPENLYVAVFNNTTYGRYQYMPDDADTTISFVISKLSQREGSVIRGIYYDQFSIAEIAAELSISEFVVRGVRDKALRMMRSKPLVDYMIRGYAIQSTIKEIEYDTTALIRSAEAQRSILLAKSAAYDKIMDARLTSMTDSSLWGSITIKDMELSPRSTCCLSRAGYKTVSDFVGKSHDDLMDIRNLGRKNYQEVVDKLHEYGIVLRVSE